MKFFCQHLWQKSWIDFEFLKTLWKVSIGNCADLDAGNCADSDVGECGPGPYFLVNWFIFGDFDEILYDDKCYCL